MKETFSFLGETTAASHKRIWRGGRDGDRETLKFQRILLRKRERETVRERGEREERGREKPGRNMCRVERDDKK